MSKAIYLATTEPNSGKSIVSLGMMQLLLGKTAKVGYFRPIIDDFEEGRIDDHIDTVLKHFEVDQKFEDSYAYTRSQVVQLKNMDKDDEIIGNIINKYKAIEDRFDIVLVEGTDFSGEGAIIEWDINVLIAKNLGITGEIPEVPSIALGTADLNVYEMVGAYGTFANQGVYVKPVMVTRIEDKNGTVLYEYVPETKDVLSKDVSYAMLDLMSGVTQGGSGTRLRTTGAEKYRPEYKEIITGYPYEFKNPIAGKTGTTQNQSDGWFMGMVPNLVTGVWVGGDDKAVHFRTITYGQGASMALPIWGLYMKKNYANKELGISDGEFEKPENLSINVDCSKTSTEEDNKIDIEDDLDF